jgi:hypothetical protein
MGRNFEDVEDHMRRRVCVSIVVVASCAVAADGLFAQMAVRARALGVPFEATTRVEFQAGAVDWKA